MAYVLQLQGLNVSQDTSGSACYSHVTSYAGTC